MTEPFESPLGEPSTVSPASKATEEAVRAAAAALAAHPWNSYPHAAHREHKFDSACAVCRGDLEPITRVILEAAALAGAGLVVVSAEDLRAYLDRGKDLQAEVAAMNRLRAALPERRSL